MSGEEQWAPQPGTGEDAALRVPGYSDLVEVARGGDSTVYRARQDSLERNVAIKVIDVDDPSAVARFDRELAITVRLGRAHPHIVTVLDTTRTNLGQPCLVMEFHDLGSLHDRLRDHGPLPVSEAVAAGTAVADALAFAHAHGVLHRDVKPQNVLLLPTSFVLSDFGIARMADAGHTASLERFSYRHASPQVLDGLEPTVADDVWSLGSTLFTLVAGRAPFAADDPDDDTALAYLRRVRTDDRRPLPSGLPADFTTIIAACLTPDREQRPDAAAALDMLRGVATERRSWAPAATVEESAAPVVVDRDDEATGQTPALPIDAPPALPVADAAPAATLHVAPSALAGLPAGSDDGEATSLRPAASQTAPEAPAEPPAQRGAWTKIVAFIGGALVVGAAFGVISALVGSDSPPPAPTDHSPTAGVSVPTDDSPVPQPSGPVQAPTSNPALAPRAPAALHEGTSVLLTWALPDQAVDYYLVLDAAADSDAPAVLAQVPGDAEEYRVNGVDPDASEACFAIVGYLIADDGRPDAGTTDLLCSPSP
ncbi:MAG TPA: serine/threonine-protein kinase [Actinomycetaceae bacterium]|nr:serine/threonine-protein kinase [Actinomycetaceae bacterium]